MSGHMYPGLPSPHRTGFALALALMLVSVLVVALMLATDGAVSTSQQTQRLRVGNDAAFAVEAVLLRREHDVIRLANIGDASKFSTWSTGNPDDGLGRQNYGVDTINGFDVLWKIEPLRTAPTGHVGRAVSIIPNLTNPSPDPAGYASEEKTRARVARGERDNDSVYLFRIAAEARDHVPANATTDGERRAQGVRIVNITGEPLFRNVIFYAQAGKKGDLELSHADPIRLEGSVHSNGAIYLGGGLRINDRLAQRGSVNGDLLPTASIIGPETNPATGDPSPVRVVGLDGVFRLNKPLMFSILNDFPISNTSVSALGVPTGNWTATGSYRIDAGDFPTSETAGNLMDLTNNLTSINPYRITDASGAVTRGPLDGVIPSLTVSPPILAGTTSARAINNVAITSDNDARDSQRTAATARWRAIAQATFENQVRTRENGGLFKPVSESIKNRGLEPQVLEYRDMDGRPETDEHEFAMPIFLDGSGRPSTNVAANGAGNPIIESPGPFLSNALGTSNAVMAREPTGTGWSVRLGAPPYGPAVPSQAMGLIIRERPVPDTDYWPGAATVPLVHQFHPRYMPYAYGKQWYPTVSPFTTMDVSDNLMRTWRFDGPSPSVMANISLAPANRVATYQGSGRLTMSAANNPGPSSSNTGVFNDYTGYLYPITSTSQAIYRRQFYYRDGWRFTHLGKYRPNESANGLKLVLYRDADGSTPTENTYQDEFRTNAGASTTNPAPAFSPLPFAVGNGFPLPGGASAPTMVAVVLPAGGIVRVSNGIPGWATQPTLPTTGYWSARWVGFWRPPTTGSYTFAVTRSSGDASSMARVWLDGERVAETGTNWSVGTTSYAPTAPAAKDCHAGTNYHLVIEYACGAQGLPYAAPVVSYVVGAAAGTLQNTQVFPPNTVGAVPAQPAPTVPLANFEAIQCRIDNPHGVISPDSIKSGLMIRPEQVVSPLQQGGSAYAMVGWSANRGFFTQRRVMPARQSLRNAGTFYIGDGVDSLGVPVTPTGTILDDSRLVPGVNRFATLSAVTPLPASYVVNPAARENSPNPSYVTTTAPTPYPGPMVRILGGNTVTILQPFFIGPWQGSRTFAPASRKVVAIRRHQTISLDNTGIPPFLSGDLGRNLSFFASSTGIALAGGGAPIITGNATNNAVGGWWFSTPAGIWSTGSPITSMTRVYQNVSGWGPWTPGTPFQILADQNRTIGTANTIWSVGPLPLQYSLNGVTRTATIAFMRNFTGNSTLSDFGEMTTDLVPVPAAWPAVTIPAANYPSATSLIDPLVMPGAPVVPTISGLTFSVDRTNSQVWCDLNPWVNPSQALTSAAQVPVSQFLPRPPTAGVWPNVWRTVPTSWPVTVGHRPDVWGNSTAAQGSGSNATTATSALIVESMTNGGGYSGVGANGYDMVDDVQPTGWDNPANQEVWLRIQQHPTIPQNLQFLGFVGNTPPSGPTDSRWVAIGNSIDVAQWAGAQLLLGPCLQSGSISTPATVNFSNLQIETSLPAPNDIIDSTDWDTTTSGGTDDMALYLLSQYQVWFGTTDISEAFFTWESPDGRRLVSEDWFFQTREFWSQSQWWDHLSPLGLAVRKDPVTALEDTLTQTMNRRLLAKTTVLSLDMELLQQFIRETTLSDAAADSLPLIGVAPLPYPGGGRFMQAVFNGLIYASRTNRYPWNPDETGPNPGTFAPGLAMPNDGSATSLGQRIINGNNLSGWADPGDASVFSFPATGTPIFHKLEPYGLAVAPAFRPQNFHHGIRLVNAQRISLGYGDPSLATSTASTNESGGQDWSYGTNPQFGSAKLTVVTPNHLYLQGSLNTHRTLVVASGAAAPVYKYAPLAVAGDQITMLSNAWRDVDYQTSNLTVQDSLTGITGGILGRTAGMAASDTWYNAGIITNNSPTTRERVLEGQGAPFTDTSRFLENWNGVAMNYLGSFIVLDSRRYTQSFLLDGPKNYGMTPFGVIANASTSTRWLNFWTADSSGLPVPAAAEQSSPYTQTWMWAGASLQVYSEANRKYKFNYDFMTSEGTPPFVPFGVSSSGVGSWIRSFR